MVVVNAKLDTVYASRVGPVSIVAVNFALVKRATWMRILKRLIASSARVEESATTVSAFAILDFEVRIALKVGA